ncbi:MAG: ligase-associated DNA damage response exonuclease [Acidobacteria bacterium]|nr:MAG: ligase-associated DNA damage response exonuclease [Acidobacteriota bacterium]
MPDLVVSTPVGLYCPAGGFHVDPWGPAERAILTHVHADHARPGSAAYLCTEASAPFVRRRMGEGAAVQAAAYGEKIRLGDAVVSFHPAGHVLGSAQIRIEAAGRVWVISGDYKRAPDPTCGPFEPVRADVFVTEATFGLPIYRWPETEAVAADVLAWWERNRRAGVASLLFCYAMGKAQRLLAELGRLTDRPVLVHGAVAEMSELYRQQGVSLLATTRVAEMPARRSYAAELVLAPLSAGGTPWVRRFGDRETALASGWMRVRGTRRRKGYDRGFVLSDHADWPALLRTIDESGAERVLATHGYSEELARYLRERGRDAGVLATAWEGEADV